MLDKILQTVQLYSYRLPTDLLGIKLGNCIMNFRKKYVFK